MFIFNWFKSDNDHELLLEQIKNSYIYEFRRFIKFTQTNIFKCDNVIIGLICVKFESNTYTPGGLVDKFDKFIVIKTNENLIKFSGGNINEIPITMLDDNTLKITGCGCDYINFEYRLTVPNSKNVMDKIKLFFEK
jgi:hypothetical protein